MHKLQVFVCKSRGTFQVGLLRHPHNVPGSVILTPPLPSSHAFEAQKLWINRFRGKLRFLWWQIAACRSDSKAVCPVPASRGQEAADAALCRLKQLLSGRILSEQRLVSVLRQEGFWPSDISEALDLGVYRAELRQLPGFVGGSWGRTICTRCCGENAQAVPCVLCGRSDCLLCLACRSMGEHRSCSTLITLADTGQSTLAKRKPIQLDLDYALTAPQQQASAELLEFWRQGGGKALVWAACGAGKTEVTFPLIRQALQEGGDVLFAIPRQDIVREMIERLRSAFPGIEVAGHYGGQPWFAPGQLVVATTHQVLHFYRRFSLAVLDEVDAFPYQGNEMLRFALERSLLPDGRLVEMTATPHSRRGYTKVITIPARYHGHPLPEPELAAVALPPWQTLTPSEFPAQLAAMLTHSANPWLIFAPTIAACRRLQEVLGEVVGRPVGLCHSKADDRSQVIQDFKNGRLGIVVTTSVLERGVNFPGVDVAVLYADHALFSVSALVQMAGRVGRDAASPRGRVLFIGSRISSPMKQALAMIKSLNEEARERGFLREESIA
ncbi:MAG: helicase-related protein [Bacillota bacterium]|jgi:competence protein ComFA|nr:helicase-related protein [Bacillota bacterium]NLJ02451.1 DEAD/DEAH box helicase family protein [Bacillota bacterium]